MNIDETEQSAAVIRLELTSATGAQHLSRDQHLQLTDRGHGPCQIHQLWDADASCDNPTLHTILLLPPTSPACRTKAQSCSANWVDATLSLLSWKTDMTDGSHGLNELNGHFRWMAHRLREWYVCVYIKRQEKWW